MPGKIWRSEKHGTITCMTPHEDASKVKIETLPLVVIPAGEMSWLPDSWRAALWEYVQAWPDSGHSLGPLLAITEEQRCDFIRNWAKKLVEADNIGCCSIANAIGEFAAMARRKLENMIEAADIRESETVATAEAKGHSDQRFVQPPYYQDDFVTIYHGDAIELLPRIRGDVLLTSPPYGVGDNNMAERHKNKYDGAGDNLTRRLLDALANANCKWRFVNIQALSANRRMLWQWVGGNADRLKEVVIWAKDNPPAKHGAGRARLSLRVHLLHRRR